MNENTAALNIAISSIKGNIPKEGSLEDRLKASMKKVVTCNEHDVFFMFGRVTEDIKMRTAIGAVMMDSTEEEKELITKSLKPLQAISAALSGVPVDFGQLDMDDVLPLLGWYNEIKKELKNG